MGIKERMLDMQSEKGNKFYTKMLKFLDSRGRKLLDNAPKLVASSGIQAEQTVLEIGCGSGFFTVEASEILGEKGKLYATDIHQMAIEETHKKVDKAGLKNVIVQLDNAMKSSFPDAIFDAVLLYGVVPAPIVPMEDVSREVYRLLKPGGIYAVWTKVPFWRPKVAVRKCGFDSMKKTGGVFRLRKPVNV